MTCRRIAVVLFVALGANAQEPNADAPEAVDYFARDTHRIDTLGARLAAWSAAFLGTAALAVFGAAAAATYAVSEILMLLGLVPWARFGAWAGVLAGVAGIVTLVLTTRARVRRPLPVGTLVGLLLTGLPRPA